MYTKYAITYRFGNQCRLIREYDTLIQADNDLRKLLVSPMAFWEGSFGLEYRMYDKHNFLFFTKQLDHNAA